MRNREDETGIPMRAIEFNPIQSVGGISGISATTMNNFQLGTPTAWYLNAQVTAVPVGKNFEVRVPFDVIIDIQYPAPIDPGYSIACYMTDGALIKAFDINPGQALSIGWPNAYPYANHVTGTFRFIHGSYGSVIAMPNNNILLNFQGWWIPEMLPASSSYPKTL
jgi:hypothetical protein